jgi:hypothetical protein
MSPLELKKALVAAGFEVYRKLGNEVILADRVRDNLIMDSGVRIRAGDTLQVRLVVGVRRGEFPGEDDAELFGRVRTLAGPAVQQGFIELSSAVAPMHDPADAARTLDTVFEVTLAKDLPRFEDAAGDLRLALSLAKTADSGG